MNETQTAQTPQSQPSLHELVGLMNELIAQAAKIRDYLDRAEQ